MGAGRGIERLLQAKGAGGNLDHGSGNEGRKTVEFRIFSLRRIGCWGMGKIRIS